MTGTGIFFLSISFGYSFIVFAVLLCRGVRFFSSSSTYTNDVIRGKGLPHLGYVRTHGMSASVEGNVRPATARDAKRMWPPSCFFLKHGGAALGNIKLPVCNYD